MAAPAGGLEEAFGDVGDDVLAELADLTVQQIKNRTDMQKNNASAIKAEMRGVEQEVKNVEAEIKQNKERIKLNTQLPYLVANVVELLDVEADLDTILKDRLEAYEETGDDEEKSPRRRGREPIGLGAPSATPQSASRNPRIRSASLTAW